MVQQAVPPLVRCYLWYENTYGRVQGFTPISNPTNPEEELTEAQKNQLKQMPKYEEARDFLNIPTNQIMRGKDRIKFPHTYLSDTALRLTLIR